MLETRTNRILFVLTIFASVMLFGKWLTDNYGFAFNKSNSLPGKIYFLDKKPGALQKGDLVSFRLKNDKFYGNATMLKKIIAMPGEIIMEPKKNLVVAGSKYLVRRDSSADGRSIDLVKLPSIIPKSQYFVYTPHPKSYDSRYFGLIKDEDILARAYPLY